MICTTTQPEYGLNHYRQILPVLAASGSVSGHSLQAQHRPTLGSKQTFGAYCLNGNLDSWQCHDPSHGAV